MPNKVWATVPLGTLIEHGRGISYGIVQPGIPSNDGIPIIRVSDIRNGTIRTASPLKVSRQIESSYTRTRLKGGELLLTLVGTVGETAVVPESLAGWNTARAVGVIPVRKDVGAYWVRLALQRDSLKQLIDSRLNTTVQATLNLHDVAQLPIILPPIDVRTSIISIIGSLDDEIELNRRMNETLEAIAQAIFKSWFVDFDPVRIKAAERNLTRASSSMTQYFLSKIIPSPAVLVASGWQTKPLSEAFEINPNRILKKATIAEYVDMGNLPVSSARVLGSIAREFTSGMRFSNGDTLVARITPCLENGKTAFVDFLKEDEIAWGSTEFIVLRPKPPLPPEYGYFLARSEEFRTFAISNMSGTSGRQHVPSNCFQNFQIVVPPEPLATVFGNIAQSFFLKMKKNDEESQILSELRDALLPKLMSGEVRLNEAEKSIGVLV